MNWSGRLRQLALGFGIGLVAALIMTGLYISSWAPLKFLSVWTTDLLHLQERASVEEPVVIVAIDEQSIATIGPWPWSRKEFAQGIDVLKAEGAKVVGIDVLFLSPSQKDPEGDRAFAEALKRAGNVVLASRVVVKNASPTGLPEPSGFDGPLPQFAEAAMAVGHVNVDASGGIVREVPFILRRPDDDLSLSLCAQLYCGYSGFDCNSFTFRLGDSISIGGQAIPIDKAGTTIANYSVVPGGFPIVSFEDLLERHFPAGFFDGKVVLIGPYWLDSKDFFPTPGGTRYGIEIHANHVRMMLRGEYMRALSSEQMIGLLLILATLTSAALTQLSFWQGSILLVFASVLVAFAWAVASVFGEISDLLGLGTRPSLIIDLPYPFLTLGFSYFGVVLFQYYGQYRQRKRVGTLFGRFVSREVLQTILASDDQSLHNPQGKQQVVSVLFSDIRGYTTISERLGAARVFDVLNEYLACLTSVIFKHHGTINKFMGDAILALFNAPLPQPDHAFRAVRAAYEMQQALRNFKSSYAPDLAVNWGIGVNTGEAMIGTVGSADRMEFTVIGDAANVAARLQALADHGEVLITESTYNLVKDRVEVRPLPPTKLKGKEEMIAIYEVLKLKEVGGPAQPQPVQKASRITPED